MSEPEPSPNTHFLFEHKVFEVNGCYFARAGGTPAVFLQIGDMNASINFSQLCSEFGIDEGDRDGELLSLVEQGLDFMPRIRPGDSIPSELLDGTASWSVEERHLAAAQARISRQLTEWLLEGSGDQWDVSIEKDEARDKLQTAFQEAAVKLGLGPEGKAQVADNVDQFAQEFSYIEALKDRVRHIVQIRAKIQQISQLARSDQAYFQELMRMEVLIATPLERMRGELDELYAQTAEIASVLRNLQVQIQYVRRVRDSLRIELQPWDDLIERWKTVQPALNDVSETLCKETYRFLAQNYQQVQTWASVL